MELFAGLAVLAAIFVGFVLALKASFWLIVFVVLPIFWLWMLVDAIVRPTEGYPTKTTNEKILWIVLMVVFQISAAVYFFMVWRAARNRETAPVVSSPAPPQTAVVAVPQATAAPTPPSAV